MMLAGIKSCPRKEKKQERRAKKNLKVKKQGRRKGRSKNLENTYLSLFG
jgi:hypothetical protein